MTFTVDALPDETFQGKVVKVRLNASMTRNVVTYTVEIVTDTATDQMIGLTFKIRAETMRGFKAKHKMLAHPYVASFLRGHDGLCDLRKII